MKTILGMLVLLAATSSVACGSAPSEGEDPTASTPPAAAKAQEPKTEANVESKVAPASYSACTPAELAACRRKDPYGSGCMIENGKVICLFE